MMLGRRRPDEKEFFDGEEIIRAAYSPHPNAEFKARVALAALHENKTLAPTRLGKPSRTFSATVDNGIWRGVPFLVSGISSTRSFRSRCSHCIAAISPRRMAVSMAQVMTGPTRALYCFKSYHIDMYHIVSGDTHIGRAATITTEQVYATADATKAEGGKSTLRSIRDRTGAGSMGTSAHVLQQWKVGEARRSPTPT
jgi:hypothetical protein